MTFILDRYHRSAAAVAPVWYEYDVQNVTFDNDEKWGKYRNVGSWFSNYHPCLTQAPLKKKNKKKTQKKQRDQIDFMQIIHISLNDSLTVMSNTSHK